MLFLFYMNRKYRIEILVYQNGNPAQSFLLFFYVHVTVHRNKFLCNKTNQMHQFHKFILSRNSTCFGQFVYPSSGDYSLYTQQWYMSYRFVDSFRAGAYACNRVSWGRIFKFLLMANLTHFIMYLFISSLYTFRASQCSSSGDQIVLIHHLV